MYRDRAVLWTDIYGMNYHSCPQTGRYLYIALYHTKSFLIFRASAVLSTDTFCGNY